MFLLPKSFGPITLQRKLGTSGVAESYVGEIEDPDKGKRQVVVRRILPYILKDRARLPSVEARVRDLLGVRHPYLVQVLGWEAVGEERFIVEQRIDGVDLERVVHWCRQNKRSLPHNIFLHIATQICTGVEALHGRPGKGTGAQNILHLGLSPEHIFVTREGKVVVGGYALTRSPTSLPHGGVSGPVPARMEYLSPEQTHPDQKLTPASDVFALGSVLYELLTNRVLFRADSNLQTIHKVRRAEVSSQLLEVKQQLPGLDKVLYRALSLNPRHRYQRAFVLREDLRGLMAGFSFAAISEEIKAFLAPLFDHMDTQPAVPDVAGFEEEHPTQVSKDPTADANKAARASREVRISQSSRRPKAEPHPPAPALAPPQAPAPQPAAPRAAVPAPPPSLAEEQPKLRHTSTLIPDGDEPRPAPTPVPAPPPSSFGQSTTAFARPTPQAPVPAPPPSAEHPRVDSNLLAEETRIRIDDEEESGEQTRIRPIAPPPELADDPEAPGESTQIRIKPGGDSPPPVLPAAPAPPPASHAPSHASGNATMAIAAAAVSAAGAAAVAAAFGDDDDGDILEADEGPEDLSQPSRVTAPISMPMPAAPPSLGPTAAIPAPPPSAGPAAFAAAPPSAGPATAGEPLAAARPIAPAPQAPAKTSPGVSPPAMTPPPSMIDRAPPPTARPAARPAAPPQVQSAAASPPAEEEERKGGMGWLPFAVGALAFLGIVGGGWALLSGPDEPDAVAEVDAAPTEVEDEAPEVAPPVEPDDEAPEVAEADEPEEDEPREAPRQPDREPQQRTARADTTYTPPARDTYTPPAQNTYTPPSTGYTAPTYNAPTRDERSREDSRDDAIADADVEIAEPSDATPVEQYHVAARSGSLTPSDVMNLEMIGTNDPSYTRSRALLLMNAEAAGDSRSMKRYLDQLMVLPENQYNPVFLSKLARYDVNRGSYRTALDTSRLAERYWARIPPELIFDTKAEIYEAQAGAYQGLFYASGSDLDLLDASISAWEKYQRHVESKGRTDLSSRAEKKLATLRDVQARLQ
jgi:serine/threonine protein kinase